jgi:hypothetical protein
MNGLGEVVELDLAVPALEAPVAVGKARGRALLADAQRTPKDPAPTGVEGLRFDGSCHPRITRIYVELCVTRG